VVEHAARRADDDGRMLREFVDLTLDRLAAVDGDAMNARPVGELFEFVAHLHGEFTRRHKHERPRTAAPAGLHHLLEDGQHERCRFAGARACLPQHVDALERPRDESRLHGRGRRVARAIDRFERRRGKPKVLESTGDSRRLVMATVLIREAMRCDGPARRCGGPARLRRESAPLFHKHSRSSFQPSGRHSATASKHLF
jgi:hypothetical protein